MVKRVVVLLHAFPLDARMWQPQREAFVSEYEIVTPDLEGFGSATSTRTVIEIDQAADTLAELIAKKWKDGVTLGGLSRGGYIALAFARRHPHLLKALILCDTRATAETTEGKDNWHKIAKRLMDQGVFFLPGVMRAKLFGETSLNERTALVRRVDEIILSQLPASVAAAARGMASRPDSEPELGNIRVPTLCIAGTEDKACEETRSIANAIPGAQFVEIPNAGHLSSLEQPEPFNAAVRSFLHRS